MKNILELVNSFLELICNLFNIRKNKNIKNFKSTNIVIIVLLFTLFIIIAVITLLLLQPVLSKDLSLESVPSSHENLIFSCELYTNDNSTADSYIYYRTNITNISEPYKVTVYPYLEITHLDNSTKQLIFLNNIFTQDTYLSDNKECNLIATIDIQEIQNQVTETIDDNSIQIKADIIFEISISQNNEIHYIYMEFNGGQPIYCSDKKYTNNLTTIDAMFFIERKHSVIEEIKNVIYNFSGKDG